MKLVKQVSSLLVTRAAVIGLTFLTGLIVARSVGPAGKGVLTVLASLVALTSVFASAGVATGGVHLYKAKRYSIGTITGVSILVWLPALLLFGVIVAGAGNALVHLFPGASGANVLRTEWIWLSFATLPAVLLAGYVQQFLLVDNNMRLYTLLNLGSQLLGLVLAWTLVAVHGWGVTGALLANLGTWSLMLLLSLVWLRTLGDEGRFRGVKEAFGPVMRASRGPFLNGIVANVFKHGEGLLLAVLLTIPQVGHYGVALAFYMLLTEVPRAVVWPLVGRMTDAGATPRDVAAKSLRVLPVVMIVPVVAMALASPFLIRFLYGEAFAPAGTLLAYMAAGVIFRSIHLVVYSYLVVTGRLDRIALCVGVAAVANLLLDVIVVPVWGLAGVAFSNVVAELILAVLSVIVFTTESRVELSNVFVRRADLQDLSKVFVRMVGSWRS